jgi:hypothetical protein
MDFANWLTWVSLASGLAVCGLVFVGSNLVLRRRSGRVQLPDDDDLPWESLLGLLKERYRNEQGAKAIESMSPEELLQALLAELPRLQRETPGGTPRPGGPQHAPEEADFLVGGAERRRSRRRWFNPTSISFFTALEGRPHHGIVVNRSAGGVALLVDQEFPEDEILFVRAVEAPKNVPVIQVRVCHCRSAGGMFMLGCEYCQELPWNVKVWFG